jgi:DNA/RNA-binding domain of Phe-tRNA-synthetase-like protein
MDITVGSNWQQNNLDAAIGILGMKAVQNPRSHPGLESRKSEIQEELQQRYAGIDRPELRSLPALAAYDQFYRQFKKTFHLQLQLESVIAGKSIPTVASLVEAMFMAELEDHVLTAGHDLDAMQPPIKLDVATGTETYTRMNGDQQRLKPGDLFICDAEGVLSSVIYGPDKRTRIRAETRNVFFTSYGVPGITTDHLIAHLERLRDYVHLISPDAEVETLEIIA